MKIKFESGQEALIQLPYHALTELGWDPGGDGFADVAFDGQSLIISPAKYANRAGRVGPKFRFAKGESA